MEVHNFVSQITQAVTMEIILYGDGSRENNLSKKIATCKAHKL